MLGPGIYSYGGAGIDYSGVSVTKCPALIGQGSRRTMFVIVEDVFLFKWGDTSQLDVQGIHFVGGKGVFVNAGAGNNVRNPYRVVDVHASDFTECAFGSNSRDMPNWGFSWCKFAGGENSTAIAFSGNTDTCSVEYTEFFGGRYHIKIDRGGCHMRLYKNFHSTLVNTDGARIWAVLNDESPNAGQGGTMHDCKFGNEGAVNDTDRMIIVAEEETFISTVTITIASPAVVTWTAHGLSAGDNVTFSTTGALPTGLTAGGSYYVVSPTTNTFQLAKTPGGAAINTSGTQSGVHTGEAYNFWERARLDTVSEHPWCGWNIDGCDYIGSSGQTEAVFTLTTPNVQGLYFGRTNKVWGSRRPYMFEFHSGITALTGADNIVFDPMHYGSGSGVTPLCNLGGFQTGAIRPFRGALVRRTANITGFDCSTIPTPIPWTTEEYDTNSIHNFSSAVTITIASPGVVTWTSHGLPAGATIELATTGMLPTGLATGTTYYVVSPATDTFQLAATPGGAAINTSVGQSGTHTATNYSVLRVPLGITKVRLHGHVRLDNVMSSNYLLLSVYKNGAQFYGGGSQQIELTFATAFVTVSSAVVAVTGGDDFELALRSESDASVDINFGYSSFSMEIIE